MIFIVLGMHKSGTTLVARTLHKSGIYMGDDFPADANYSKSKFEAKWPQKINDQLLGVDRDLLSLNVTSGLLPNNIENSEIESMMYDGIRRMSAEHQDWGFKDPRTCLTYGYWKKTLQSHRVIVIYRDPVDVWRRYSRINRRWYSRRAFIVWADYNKCILRGIADLPEKDILFIKFDDLLTNNEEFSRLERFAEKKLDDVREPAQSRFRLAGNKVKLFRYKVLKIFAGREVYKIYSELERRHAS